MNVFVGGFLVGGVLSWHFLDPPLPLLMPGSVAEWITSIASRIGIVRKKATYAQYVTCGRGNCIVRYYVFHRKRERKRWVNDDPY